ncbi:MAG: CrcB family protein [Vicinamibacterales bacterium]
MALYFATTLTVQEVGRKPSSQPVYSINLEVVMSAWLAVGVGGALGSMARHAVNRFVLHNWPALQVPAATIVVNLCGCAIIGVLAGAAMSGKVGPGLYWREFVIVGLLGGFTTFSTFGVETITLMRTGFTGIAVANIGAQVIGGLLAVHAGLATAQRLLTSAP